MHMQWFSIVAIYGLFWVLSAFLVMPFGLRTPHEEGETVEKGHADSAAVFFALYYANYVNGWITLEDLNFFGKPPVEDLGY